MSERKDLELLKKIHAISTINQEIIERIKSKKKVVTCYHYDIVTQNSFKFEVKETKDVINVSDILYVWEPSVKMNIIPDLFKDKIDYNCSNFTDVIRLNKEMDLVAEQYRMFGGSTEAVEVIEKFLANFELLQVGLGSLEEKLMDAKSKMKELEIEAKMVNEKVETLVQNSKTIPTENKWIREYKQKIINGKSERKEGILVGMKDWQGIEFPYHARTVIMRALPCPHDGELTQLYLAVKGSIEKADCWVYIVSLTGNTISYISSPCKITVQYSIDGWQKIKIPPTPIRKGQYVCLYNQICYWNFKQEMNKKGNQLYDMIHGPQLNVSYEIDENHQLCFSYYITI